ncbi:MAG: hypothetical protein AAF368_18425 [Planctomycetota bacterium]
MREPDLPTPIMADPIYVHVAKASVKSIFDSKHKAKVQEALRKRILRVLEKSRKLSTKEPRSKEDKAKEGFYIDPAVERLVMGEVKGKTLIAIEIRLTVATWPRKKMLFFAPGKAKYEVAKPDKVQGDVVFLVESVAQDVMEKKVLKELERRLKSLQT